MAGNSFGEVFRITTCGESHGGDVAVIIDGCPAGLAIDVHDIQAELDRRRPGQSDITTSRKEEDIIHILSGIFEGQTTGAPILLLAHNTDMRHEDYRELKDIYRPSHADFTYIKKYGIRDFRGSGRASARETLARVAAGAIAKKYLKVYFNVEILSYVEQVGDISTTVDYRLVSMQQIESNIVRCPDQDVAHSMIKLIDAIKNEGDSIGGVIRGVIRNAPIGLGEPVFDKISADLGKAMLSINAAKGFDIGAGFAAASMRGSEHNDIFLLEDDIVKLKTNYAGGVLGGITTGQDIYFRVAFKPVATINKSQNTVNIKNESVVLQCSGRHDPCVLPRAVPIVDAMSALVIMDHCLRNKMSRV